MIRIFNLLLLPKYRLIIWVINSYLSMGRVCDNTKLNLNASYETNVKQLNLKWNFLDTRYQDR